MLMYQSCRLLLLKINYILSFMLGFVVTVAECYNMLRFFSNHVVSSLCRFLQELSFVDKAQLAVWGKVCLSLCFSTDVTQLSTIIAPSRN